MSQASNSVSAFYVTRFVENALGLDISLRVPRSLRGTSREQLWLKHVAPLFVSASKAWIRYGEMAPKYGRRFGAGRQSVFELFWRKRRDLGLEAAADTGAGVEVSSAEIPTDELKRRAAAAKGSERKTGAEIALGQVGDKIQQVFDSVGRSSFKSDAAAMDFRLALASEPSVLQADSAGDLSVSGSSAQTRRQVQTVYRQVKIPFPESLRKLRSNELKMVYAQPEDFGLLPIVQPDSIQPARLAKSVSKDASELLGLVYDFGYQLRMVFDTWAKNGLLSSLVTEPSAVVQPETVKLSALFASDGVTPTNTSVVSCLLQILDPNQRIFLKRASPVFRLLCARLSEAGIKKIIGIRNSALFGCINSK